MKHDVPLGTSEIFGVDMRRRQAVVDTIRSVYETFGFEPLHTPILENAEVFNGHHGEGEKLLFIFTDSQGERLVNRYDLTVPLARFAGSHPEIPRPLKRYQIETVFRDDKPDLGHFREFTQCDGDVVGSACLSADVEVINVAHFGLSKLGFGDFTIRVNHRGIIRAIAEKAGVFDDAGVLMVQRALDFSDKVTKSGIEGIRHDLIDYGAPENVIDTIIEMILLDGDNALEKLSAIEHSLSFSGAGRAATSELRTILEMVPDAILDKVSVDLTLARGADYYTGFILEGVITSAPVGAVLGGGRYDNLVGKFGDKPEPAVGMAFGLERILTAMAMLHMIEDIKLPERVLVVSRERYGMKASIGAVMRLRQAGISTEYVSIEAVSDITSYFKHRAFSAMIEVIDGRVVSSRGSEQLLNRVLTLLD
jgi:tRNA synthetases class II core domain (F)